MDVIMGLQGMSCTERVNTARGVHSPVMLCSTMGKLPFKARGYYLLSRCGKGFIKYLG
jgi:hypothetical protein